ncbi:hypothetical protein [Ahrensia sp. 13_GOM-1096m]|uniref:phage tail assembly chaperone n=1 Tax=Ahrensia sp. 13_GOM-1096m TaxID=1380380 RepID=UPI0006880B4F|nr:hypothetical protein [Ahrensia sp. 13_GOM-1096m]
MAPLSIKSQRRLKAQLVKALEQHLQSGAKSKIPEAGEWLWFFFCQISKSRTYHANGPNPLQWSEIEAWMRLYRWPLEAHHIDIIRALDETWIKHSRSDQQAPSQQINTGAFDAVFG